MGCTAKKCVRDDVTRDFGHRFCAGCKYYAPASTLMGKPNAPSIKK